MIESLSTSKKERVQPSGTHIAKWLTAMSMFCGNLWRKHNIDLLGLLNYLVSQLLNENIYDLAVLQELVSQMTGVKILEEAAEGQLEAYAGGENLKREALMFEQLRVIRKSSARLTRALLDSDLAARIGILLAVLRRDCLFGEENVRDLKILAWRFDLVCFNSYWSL